MDKKRKENDCGKTFKPFMIFVWKPTFTVPFYPSFTLTAKIGPIFVVRPKKIGKFLSFRPILCNWIRFWLFL